MDDGILRVKESIRPLEMVSPSRLHSLRSCSHKEVWSCGGSDELLPGSPKSELGSITHKIIEEAGMGFFVGAEPAAIEERWDALVENSEKRMKKSWLVRHFVPLKDSAPGFEVRRLQAVERAVELNDGYSEGTVVPKVAGQTQEYGYEIPVDSHSGFVRGRIDAVLSSESGPVLRDYKSGYILEKNGEHGVVKRDYVV